MPRASTPRLLLIATAPVTERDGCLVLDKKFVEGMRLHREMWPGAIECLLRKSDTPIPFGALYRPQDLGFDLTLLETDEKLKTTHLDRADVVLCGADAHDMLHVADLGGTLGIPVFFTIEYTLDARLQIAGMDRTRSVIRRTYSKLWTVWQEFRRRRALRMADGIQANGYPAAKAYGRLNRNMMMYLDNRLRRDMFATPVEIERKAARFQSGAALRLIHSGRLEAMKGAHDLIPFAQALRARGVDFTLDIYGDGTYREEIAAGIRNHGLGQVQLHSPVDFETVLVPINRTEADIFISCHRQSDPSCTYVESLGCGVPIVGYGNAMWSDLASESGGGWVVPTGDVGALADRVRYLSKHRDEIAVCALSGLQFARSRDFVTEFCRRMDHARTAHQSSDFPARDMIGLPAA